MKHIVFADGTVFNGLGDGTSCYCLILPSTDPEDISEFQELLTIEHLAQFEIRDENDQVTDGGEDFMLMGVNLSTSMMDPGSEDPYAMFSLRPLTPAEIRLNGDEVDIEASAEAIEEIAGIVADLMPE